MARVFELTDRRCLLALAGLLAVHAALAWWLRAPAVSTGHDDAMYLLLGRELLHGSYRNVWLIGSPPHGLYPPLYPAVLAVAGATGEQGFPIAIGVNILLSVGCLAIFAMIAWSWSGPIAVLAVAVAATNPMIVKFAGTILSESLFGLLLVATILCASRSGSRAAMAAGALAIAAALARSIGITVIAGLLGVWLLHRQWRRAIGLAAASALLVGSWMVWSATVPGRLAGESYWGDIAHDQLPAPIEERAGSAEATSVAISPSLPASGPTEPPPVRGRPLAGDPGAVGRRLVHRVLYNARGYLTESLADVFSIPGIPDTKLDNIAGLLIAIVLGVFGVMELWRRLPVAILIGVGYGAVLLVWPYLVGRFLLPLVPVVVLALVLGAKRLTSRFPGSWSATGPIAIAGLLITFHLAGLRRAVRAEAGCDRARPLESSCYPPVARGYLQAVALAGRRTPPTAIFLTPKPATLYYLTGRRSVNELEAASLDAPRLADFLDRNRVDFVLLSRIHVDQLTIGARMQDLCTGWTVLGSFDEGGTLLLGRRGGDGVTTVSDGCGAVRTWRAKSTGLVGGGT